METRIDTDEYVYDDDGGSSSKKEIEWLDVSIIVERATKEFGEEELLHGTDFSMFESMSALELCEPKMDPTPRPLPRITRLLENIDIEKLSVEEVLLSAREIMRRELKWLDGRDAAKSVLQCIWLRDQGLKALEHGSTVPCLAMRAIAAATLRIVQACRLAIICADIYEEEDFGLTPNIDAIISLQDTWELLRQASARCGKQFPQLGDQVRLRFFTLRAVTALLAKHNSRQVLADLDACQRFLSTEKTISSPNNHQNLLKNFRQFFFMQIDSSKTYSNPVEDEYKIQFLEPLRKVAELRQYLEKAPHEKISLTKVIQCIEIISSQRIVPRSLAALEIGCEALRQKDAIPSSLMLGSITLDSLLFPHVQKNHFEFRELACFFIATMLRDRCLTPSRLHIALKDRLLPDCAQLRAFALHSKENASFALHLALELSLLYLDTLLQLDLIVDLPELEFLFAYQLKILNNLKNNALARLRIPIAAGLSHLVTALISSQIRKLSFGSWRLRFQAHFQVLDQTLNESPAHLCYDKFLSDIQQEPNDANRQRLLETASDAFMRAKQEADLLLQSSDIDKAQLLALTKVAVANRVVAAKALRRYLSSSKPPAKGSSSVSNFSSRKRKARFPELDHRFHHILPVLIDPAEDEEEEDVS